MRYTSRESLLRKDRACYLYLIWLAHVANAKLLYPIWEKFWNPWYLGLLCVPTGGGYCRASTATAVCVCKRSVVPERPRARSANTEKRSVVHVECEDKTCQWDFSLAKVKASVSSCTQVPDCRYMYLVISEIHSGNLTAWYVSTILVFLMLVTTNRVNFSFSLL